MSQYSIVQLLPFIAWLIALIEFILGVYALVLNAWHTANRQTFALLIVIALNSFAIGSMASSTTVGEATTATIILAITTFSIEPMLLVSSIALFRSGWLNGRGRWLWVAVYVFAFIPIILTASDLWLNTHYWYAGLSINAYSGGYLISDQIAAGQLARPIQLMGYALFTGLTFCLLLYFALSKRKASQYNRRLAWLLLGGTTLAGLSKAFLTRVIDPGWAMLITGAVLTSVYGYACFAQMNLEHRLQRGSLQVRLTALVLTVSLPLIITISAFVTSRAGKLLEAYALNNLRNSNHLLTSQLNLWLDANGKVLQAFAKQADIASMDPIRQKPALEAMALTYPSMFLISTTDLDGLNVARSDQGSRQNFQGTDWFSQAAAGAPLTYATVPSNASGSPILVASTPIYSSGKVVGVGMFSTDLAILNTLVQANPVGRRGFALILNDKNQIVSSSDPAQVDLLKSIQSGLPEAETPPLQGQILGLGGQTGSFTKEAIKNIVDKRGARWRVVTSALDNQWRVVILLPESELMANVVLFKEVSWIVLGLGTLLLLALSWLTIRQAIQPVRVLTETATSIAAGDLTRVAPVESDNEIGVLARAFNSMTGQLRELIANLERRVGDRTHELEHRATQLQVTAEVASTAATVRDQDELLTLTVQLISDRLNYYHAGIFLIDEAKKFAVLQAASSPGGQRMLANGHKLEVGKVGIVGKVAGTGRPHIALDVGEEAIFFNNPDLPQTRSEMSLPLNVRGKVIGVLDVQSTKAAAFSAEDISTLQVLADQVALAIDNTRLMAETQQTLQELKSLYELQVGQAWQKRLGNRKIAYAYTRIGVKPAVLPFSPDPDGLDNSLNVPILFRGQPLGSLVLTREEENPPWSLEDIEVVNSIATQVGLALENVRLLEETQLRAERERQITEITAKLRTSNDPQVIMKTAADELQRVLHAKHTRVVLKTDQPAVNVLPSKTNGHDIAAE